MYVKVVEELPIKTNLIIIIGQVNEWMDEPANPNQRWSEIHSLENGVF